MAITAEQKDAMRVLYGWFSGHTCPECRAAEKKWLEEKGEHCREVHTLSRRLWAEMTGDVRTTGSIGNNASEVFALLKLRILKEYGMGCCRRHTHPYWRALTVFTNWILTEMTYYAGVYENDGSVHG